MDKHCCNGAHVLPHKNYFCESIGINVGAFGKINGCYFSALPDAERILLTASCAFPRTFGLGSFFASFSNVGRASTALAPMLPRLKAEMPRILTSRFVKPSICTFGSVQGIFAGSMIGVGVRLHPAIGAAKIRSSHNIMLPTRDRDLGTPNSGR